MKSQVYTITPDVYGFLKSIKKPFSLEEAYKDPKKKEIIESLMKIRALLKIGEVEAKCIRKNIGKK